MAKLLAALSGGVDSAVAALRLLEQGHTVEGAYIKTWMNEEGSDVFARCPWEKDAEDARLSAGKLGIPFRMINLIDDYRKRVVEYLVEGYRRGVTPNPDIMCNREMKFGVFRDLALATGFDGVATGHYVRKTSGHPDGLDRIAEGKDPNKDQSYFLALLRQEQVASAWFPVGDMLKPAVRALAARAGLPVADKKDSQGICFLGKVSINDFLRLYIPDQPGEIINTEGRVVGEHPGLHHFTLGQRKGMGVPSNTDHQRYVVVAKDFKTNQLVVAFDGPDAPGLFSTAAIVRGLSWIAIPPDPGQPLTGKVRYRDPHVDLTFDPLDADRARITFATPQRALAPGQILAFYQGETLLGGGVYESLIS